MANEKRLDLIERNALKDALRTKEGAEALGHSVHRLFCVDEIIDAQPTVDAVEVVHGRWTTRTVANWLYEEVCSVCGFCGCEEFNYCPNCGAKMDGGKDK